MFRNRFNKLSPSKGESRKSGRIIVVTDGYIPVDKLVKSMAHAGQQLALSRAIMYDYGPTDDDNDGFLDPLRAPNLDLVDMQAAQDRLVVAEANYVAAKDELQRKARGSKSVPVSASQNTGTQLPSDIQGVRDRSSRVDDEEGTKKEIPAG